MDTTCLVRGRVGMSPARYFEYSFKIKLCMSVRKSRIWASLARAAKMFFCHRPNLISFSSFHLLPLLSCGGGRCRSKCGSGGECAVAWLSSSLSFPLSSLSSLSRTSLTTEDMASVAEIHVTAARGRQCPADGGSSLRLVPLACALLSGRWGGEASLRYWLVLAGNSILLACALLRRVMFVCALLRWAVMCVSVEKSLGSGNLECM